MKENVKSMFINRPHWCQHEGYWRLLVVVRFLLFIPTMLWAVMCIWFGIMAGDLLSGLGYCLLGTALAFCLVLLFNFLVGVVGWVVSGFKN